MQFCSTAQKSKQLKREWCTNIIYTTGTFAPFDMVSSFCNWISQLLQRDVANTPMSFFRLDGHNFYSNVRLFFSQILCWIVHKPHCLNCQWTIHDASHPTHAFQDAPESRHGSPKILANCKHKFFIFLKTVCSMKSVLFSAQEHYKFNLVSSQFSGIGLLSVLCKVISKTKPFSSNYWSRESGNNGARSWHL